MLGSVSKAGRVLQLFTSSSPDWGVSEVAAELGIAKSSAHALLVTLDDIGLVRRLTDGRFRLGWRILELSRNLQESTDLLGPHRARLRRIAVGTQAAVHVGALRGREVIYLDHINGEHGVSSSEAGVGRAMPAHCSALGKVLLAWLGPAERNAMLALHGLPRLTPATVTDAATVQEELARVRLLGYAVDEQEALPGRCCVAAPIRDRYGDVEAAVSLSVPTARFPDRYPHLRAVVCTASDAISRARRHETDLLMPGPGGVAHRGVAPARMKGLSA